MEGPNRQETYYNHLCNIHSTKIQKIIFQNIIYWFTEKDDLSIKSPIKRIKYYCYKSNCGPRLYAWRGNQTNISRRFGHPARGENISSEETALSWKTRHYEIRSKEHFNKKIKDREGIRLGDRKLSDWYNTQKDHGIIKSNELHYDNGEDEINMEEIFNWKKIY